MNERSAPSFPGVESGGFTGLLTGTAAAESCRLLRSTLNIILFHPSEVELPLPRQDARARHILTVLRRGRGETFDAGLVDGPVGKATLVAVRPEDLLLTFQWGAPPPPLAPIHLLLGLPRPQTARDILREGTALGVASLDFVRTERAETSYAQSRLWSSDEWRQLLLAGAAQAVSTRLPQVNHGRTLAEAVEALPDNCLRVALDNYEATAALADGNLPAAPTVVLAFGAERGWSGTERTLLRRRGFQLRHLGPRVLRLETACIAAVTLVKAQQGWA